MRKGSKHKLNYRGSPEERFWSKVKKTKNCWLWIGAHDNKGYGDLRINGKNINAHRYAYILKNGKLDKDVFVCHTCDTPSCVNPKHLWLGSNYDNVQDMVKKMRHTFGERNGQAKLTEEQVKQIRELKANNVCTQEKMTKIFGVSRTIISQIITGARWKHSYGN